MSEVDSINDRPVYFRPFTRDSLKLIQQRIADEEIKTKEIKAKEQEKMDDDEDYDHQPEPKMEQGAGLPIRLATAFEDQYANIPLEDFDPYYKTIPTFVVVTQKKEIYRFSAHDCLYILSPFNPVRRVAVTVLTHQTFSLVIITTIVFNCYVMILVPASPFVESTEVAFTTIYTFESAVKVMARGFILERFTYMRDMWNWIDFLVISMAYITMGIDVGNFAVLRTCRVFRALKTVAIVPGLKTIVGAVIVSVKNLRDVIILTLFALSVFSLIGLQLYMGVLTQKCILDWPDDNGSQSPERDILWHNWNLNFTHWFPFPPPAETIASGYPLCGNSTGAGQCPVNHTCLQGYGKNPNYGYTSFDSFGWAFLSAFRLMTRDFWESLYQQILRTAGPWHVCFFIVIVFLGSYYLVNLILAIVAMSYDELQRKTEKEAMEDAEELRAMRVEEEARRTRAEARAAWEAAENFRLDKSSHKKSVQFSEAGNFKPCAGIKDENTFGEKASVSLPGSPYNKRRASHLYCRDNLTEAKKRLPFAYDSTVTTPMNEDDENDATILPFSRRLQQTQTVHKFGSRRSSYNSRLVSRGRRVSDLVQASILTKESQLIKQAKNLYGLEQDGDDVDKVKGTNFERGENSSSKQLHSGSSGLDMEDMMVLNELIDQAAGSSMSHASGGLGEEPAQRLPFKARLKAFVIKGCLQCLDLFCVWDFGFPWCLLKRMIGWLVFDAFTELFITFAIVVNTVFMALDHYGLEQNYTMSKVLKSGNTVFTTIFGVECVMKVIAMSPKFYFQVGWNTFDFVIVFFALVEVVFEGANVPGLSALRSLRLLRVFKLAKSWPALNMILTVMSKTIGALANLIFVLLIILFIFAVMGMQLFARNYVDRAHLFPGGELPRWNFTDFGHSFMVIFRVLCGEWIESMWDCMVVTGFACVPYFVTVVLIGNLVLLNLFLALLLSNYGNTSSTPTLDEDSNKLGEAFDRFVRFFKWIKSGIRRLLRANANLLVRGNNSIMSYPSPPATPDEMGPQDIRTPTSENRTGLTRAPTFGKRRRMAEAARKVMYSKKVVTKLQDLKDEEMSNAKNEEENLPMKPFSSHKQKKVSDGEDDDRGSEDWTSADGDEIDRCWEPGVSEALMAEQVEECPDDCMPQCFFERFPVFAIDDTPFGDAWASLRLKTFRLIEDKYFETVVIVMILFSSLALALEDVHLPGNPFLADHLFYVDRVFTIIFLIEMFIKWIALGFVAYFTNAWCWLDFVIVMVSLINFVAALTGYGSVQAFKKMRTLRALRPLRAMARMQNMRLVVNALIQSIPSIFNILLVCLIFWLIFAIMGVQLFNGKFHKCLDPEDGSRPDYRIIRNKMECLVNNFTWENSVMNFDHVGKAYLCLFQVATFKGWIAIMNDAIDSREIDDQPHRETNFVMYLYFVVFIIFGSFFTLNLFIGVIIDNINEQQKKGGESISMFMTEDQKAYYATMQKIRNKKPIKAIPKPTWKPQAILFEFVTDKKFDMVIMLFIGLNMITMMCDQYQMSQAWDSALNIANAIFVAIFSAESLLKMFALRHHYFGDPWNIFDFFVVCLSIGGMLVSDFIEQYFLSPTLFRVVRVAKVGRVLRLVKGAKGIRTLLFALAMSLPALFNICLLLFLVMFIFSIFGMSLFMNVKLRGALDDVYNFQTFFQSFILLFQMSTSAGWDGVLDGIMNDKDCQAPDPELEMSGDCGNSTAGITFLLSYLVLSFLIIINMYVAVILENFSQATEDVYEGLTDDDYEMYYEIWAQFDPNCCQYIKFAELSDFLAVLEHPLQIQKPNKYKIVSLDIPIREGDMLYCVDILDALTKDFFARKGHPIADNVEVNEVIANADLPGYETISSTLWRQREEYSAKLIQNLWRAYKAKQ